MGDATVRAGARAIARGSQSFAAAARLFDRDTRDSAVMLYAWCRYCDDVVDGQEHGHAPRGDAGRALGSDPAGRLAELAAQTRAALAGVPTSDPVFAGLARVVARHAIPHAYPLAHLDGFRMDVEGRRYETIEATLAYCYGVAGVVGLMMAHVMGEREPAILDRACDLGLAFQLTNIARDIVPDARAGRLYLPLDWLREAGIPPDRVADPGYRDPLADLAARLVDVAEPYYASAGIGISALPPRAAWAVATARGVYRQIGLEVRRRGARAWDERVSTSALHKIMQVAAGGRLAWRRRQIPSARRIGLWTRPA